MTPASPQISGKADTLFKGETLRSILLNAYGWWTVATIALFAGLVMLAAGLILGILAILGFRHGRRVVVEPERTVTVGERMFATQNA